MSKHNRIAQQQRQPRDPARTPIDLAANDRQIAEDRGRAAWRDLLAALEAITARNAPNSDMMGDAEFDEFSQARAAIAKATGK